MPPLSPYARLGALALVAVLLVGCDGADPLPVRRTFHAQVRQLHAGGPPSFYLQNTETNDPRDAYFPLNLPAAYMEEGAHVWVDGYLRDDLGEIYFMRPVEIIRVEPREGPPRGD